MTSKERVFAVHPDARCCWIAPSDNRRYGVFIGAYAYDKRIGEGITEEAAWQNAAESLPAEPAPDDPNEKQCVCWGMKGCEICGGSGELPNEYAEPVKVEGKHRFMAGTCVDCGKPLAKTCVSLPPFEPVAPVGAKYLMPRDREPKWLLMFDDADRGYSTFNSEVEGREAWTYASDSWNCTLFAPVPAEPKPTPSTRINTCTCNPDICKCDIGCCPCQDEIRNGKSQPDSSSIPDEQTIDPALKLLADVMHLWIDGYISKSPNSAAPDAISQAQFDEIERFLAARGISVDYCGWHVDSSSISTDPAQVTPEAHPRFDPAYLAIGQSAELNHLAHTLAYESCCSVIESETIGADEDWQSLEQTDMDALKDEIRYLEMRGLLERHPQHPHWVRFHDESEATA